MLTFIGFIILIAVAFVVLSFLVTVVVGIKETISDVFSSVPAPQESLPPPPRREPVALPAEPKTKGRKKAKNPPVNEYVFVDGREPEDLYNHSSMKEYVLPDGSKINVNTEETSVVEKPATQTTKTSAERFGGGMAEIIRKRREEEVF